MRSKHGKNCPKKKSALARPVVARGETFLYRNRDLRDAAHALEEVLRHSKMTTSIIDTASRVAVGSKNPVKVAAVRAVMTRLGSTAVVEGVAVASGVPDQPFGDDETIRGALERAREARRALDADVGVGIEGGVVEMADGSLRTCAWAAVVVRDGRHGVGGSLAMPLPDSVARLIRERGMELGHAMDQLTGQHNVKQGSGAVGILTRGLVARQGAYEVLVAYAAGKFLVEL
jgi:inosine/xanthosine triphosphatase